MGKSQKNSGKRLDHPGQPGIFKGSTLMGLPLTFVLSESGAKKSFNLREIFSKKVLTGAEELVTFTGFR